VKSGVKFYRSVQTRCGQFDALVERVPGGLAVSSISKPHDTIMLQRDESIPVEVQVTRDLQRLAAIAADATASSASASMTFAEAGAVLADDENRLLERGIVATRREAHIKAMKRNPVAARVYTGYGDV
jgi:hypothetical protein